MIHASHLSVLYTEKWLENNPFLEDKLFILVSGLGYCSEMKQASRKVRIYKQF